jgi:hypothetical protein
MKNKLLNFIQEWGLIFVPPLLFVGFWLLITLTDILY